MGRSSIPVTSLPIYGLRNRAGPGSFCRHMANLHTGLAVRAQPSSPGTARRRRWTPSVVWSSRPLLQPVLRAAESSWGRARSATPRAVAPGERAGRDGSSVSWGREEFRFSETFQKRRRSGSGSSASPALVWEPFRKIKLRKETERSRDTRVKPLLHFLGSSKPQAKRDREKKKKKNYPHSRKLTAFF